MSTTFAGDGQFQSPSQGDIEILFPRKTTRSTRKPGTSRFARVPTGPQLETRPLYRPATPRTDRELETACAEALRWATTLTEQAVQVSVRNGQAILQGQVSQTAQSQAAETVIRGIPGIIGVQNEIRIG